jgi:hypothetical protein
MKSLSEQLKDKFRADGPMTREQISEFIKTHKHSKTPKEIAESLRARWSKENLVANIFRIWRNGDLFKVKV